MAALATSAEPRRWTKSHLKVREEADEPLQKLELIICVTVILCLILLPHMVNPYWVHTAFYTLWMTYLLIAWLIPRNTHVVNFAHMAFVGIGAYTSTLLFNIFGFNPWLGCVIGALLSAMAIIVVNSIWALIS